MTDFLQGNVILSSQFEWVNSSFVHSEFVCSQHGICSTWVVTVGICAISIVHSNLYTSTEWRTIIFESTCFEILYLNCQSTNAYISCCYVGQKDLATRKVAVCILTFEVQINRIGKGFKITYAMNLQVDLKWSKSSFCWY